MSSKELKDLIIVNLTGIIAVATSINTMFPQSTTTAEVHSLIQKISLFYWACIAGLFVSYIYVHQDEKKQYRNIPIAHIIETQTSQKIEKIYSSILLLNLYLTAVLIIALWVYSNYPSIQDHLILFFWLFIPLSIIIVLVAIVAIAYLPLASLYFYIKGRIGVNPVMLFGAGFFFEIAFKLWTHL